MNDDVNNHPIPIDGQGFYQCNPDAQLDAELIQCSLNHVIEQNTLIMEAALYAVPRAQQRKMAERWNEANRVLESKVQLVERRYLERHKNEIFPNHRS